MLGPARCINCRYKAVFEHMDGGIIWDGSCWAWSTDTPDPIRGIRRVMGKCSERNADGNCRKFRRETWWQRNFCQPDVIL